MLETARLENPRILFSSSWAEFHYRYQKARFLPNSLWRDLEPVDWLVTRFERDVYMTSTSWLVSRTLTELAGPWDERLTVDDDGEYFARLVSKSNKIIFVPKARSYYRRHSLKSLSSGCSENGRQSQFLSKILCIGYLRGLEDSERTRKACMEFLRSDLSFLEEDESIMQEVSILAGELGGELSPTKPKWRLFLARVILGRKLAAKIRRWNWELKVLIKVNWDRLLFVLIDQSLK